MTASDGTVVVNPQEFTEATTLYAKWVVNVAQVGETKYESLAEALEAAKGETNIVVNLLTNATLDITAWDTLAIGGDSTTSITINGNNAWLDSGSFLDCRNLKEVHFTGSAPQYVIAYGLQNATAQASFGDVTWYYDCNQSGWLNSNRYHGETKTWAGYPLVA
jgi:hypothetical protein